MTEREGQSVADVIGEKLAASGCKFAFGIPGGEVLSLMAGLEAAGLRFLRVRHESSGGFMAEGTYRADGAPGVLVATVGPGMANSVLAVANAFQERVPLVVLTGCVDAQVQGIYTHQVFDQQALLKPVVKGTFRVTKENARALLDQALDLATRGRPGPVHLDVPVAVAAAEAAPSAPPDVGQVVEPEPAHTDHQALAEFADRLAKAKRPLVVAGLDLVSPRIQKSASTVLMELASDLGAPVITTYKGKGLLRESDGLSLGAAGLSPTADSILLPLVQQADVVLCAGYDPIEMRLPWRNPFAPGATVLELSAESVPHGMFSASASVFGDVLETLSGVRSALAKNQVRDQSSVRRWADGEPESARSALRSAFAPGETFDPRSIGHALFASIDDDAFVGIDTGAHRIVLSQLFVGKQPGKILQSSGLCTMGAAVPLAIGAKLAAPETQSVAVVGDGGLDMFLGELLTAREAKLGIPVIVFDDRCLALIELKQRRMSLPELAVSGEETDYAAVGAALGGRGVLVASENELRSAVHAAFNADTFTIIHVPVDRGAYDGRL